MLGLHGQGRMDEVPAGDLGFLKIVGRLLTGNPRARADEARCAASSSATASGRGWPACT